MNHCPATPDDERKAWLARARETAKNLKDLLPAVIQSVFLDQPQVTLSEAREPVSSCILVTGKTAGALSSPGQVALEEQP